MKNLILIIAVSVLPLQGQLGLSRIPAKDRKITSEQQKSIYEVVRPVTKDASEVVFTIFSDRTHIGYGVSVGEGKLLAKWSEIAPKSNLQVYHPKYGAKVVTVEGSYPDHDLVVLHAEGLDAPAAKWADSSELLEGSFLVAARPDATAAGIGVKSVAARSLRAEDQGFLGVLMDTQILGKGVEILEVVEGTAAAEAGLRKGDIILEIKGEKVKGFQEVSTQLKKLRAGETPEVLVSREGKEFTVTPKLQGTQEGRKRESRRLRQMNEGSGDASAVRDIFSNVVQSDMELEAVETGLPVVDLDGKIMGMVIARAGRISTLILPGEEIIEILKEEPYKLESKPRGASERRR